MTLEEVDPQLRAFLEDREWRLNHLYWIEDKQGRLMRLKMNQPQERFYRNIWKRNHILKARQFGMSTLMSMMELDACLFKAHCNCAIVDKTLDDAKGKLKKARLAYDLLDYVPENATAEDRALAQIGKELKAAVPMKAGSKTELEWENGSVISCGVSKRGGTLQLLHISELASIARHAPQKAQEVLSGALQAVNAQSYIVIETTHEGGRAGLNYEMMQAAMANAGKELSPMQWRFHFFPWFDLDEYEEDPVYWPQPKPEQKVAFEQHRRLAEYFDGLERSLGIELNPRKRAWYALKRQELGDLMKQEYPSTPDETFDALIEGSIYARELSLLKMAGALMAEFVPQKMRPVYTSWDLGHSDSTCVWLWQLGADGKFYLLDHYAASRKSPDHFVGVVRGWMAQYGVQMTKCLLPHDGNNQFNGQASYAQLLRNAGLPVSVVPRTNDPWVGINLVRMLLPNCVFHERCSREIRDGMDVYPSGVQSLEQYRTLPDGSNGAERATPLHDKYSHSADAFRMFAEARQAGLVSELAPWNRPLRNGSNTARGAEWLRR